MDWPPYIKTSWEMVMTARGSVRWPLNLWACDES